MTQSKNGHTQVSPFNKTPVEAFALFILLWSSVSFASTGRSSFANTSWNSDSGSSHRSSARAKDAYSGEISPFSPGSHNLSVDLGQVFLMGDLTSRYANSLGTQLHYAYGVSDLFGFDTSLGFSQHSNGKYSLTTLLSGLRMNLSWYDKIIPYIVFGLGFYMPNYSDNSVPGRSASISSVLFGLHIGPGIQLELSKNMFFGASILYHNMFGVATSWADGEPLNVGGAYTSFFMNIGVTF